MCIIYLKIKILKPHKSLHIYTAVPHNIIMPSHPYYAHMFILIMQIYIYMYMYMELYMYPYYMYIIIMYMHTLHVYPYMEIMYTFIKYMKLYTLITCTCISLFCTCIILHVYPIIKYICICTCTPNVYCIPVHKKKPC